MFSLDMNKRLWKDERLFKNFFYTVLILNREVKNKNQDPNVYLNFANKLDDIMQEYEDKYDSLQDPIFFWSFASSNALFLIYGRKFDELGDVRIQYILNGYKEGLYKHIDYPSYPKIYIDFALDHIRYFGKDYDIEWVNKNRHKFLPIAE